MSHSEHNKDPIIKELRSTIEQKGLSPERAAVLARDERIKQRNV